MSDVILALARVLGERQQHQVQGGGNMKELSIDCYYEVTEAGEED
jgi:hypothetical protein